MHPIERAALHESAHALLCHLSPELPRIRAVAALPDRPGEGETLLGDPTAEGLSDEALYEWARMLCAGPIAERIATGDAPGAAGDVRELAHLGELLVIGSVRRALAECSDLAELETALDAAYADALRMLRRAAAASELLVRARWRAVEHLARYVAHADGVVRGVDVAAILADAPAGGRAPTAEGLRELLRDATGDPIVERELAAVRR